MLELRGVQRQEGHKGKTFVEVGRRQQQRFLKEMRYLSIEDIVPYSGSKCVAVVTIILL